MKKQAFLFLTLFGTLCLAQTQAEKSELYKSKLPDFQMGVEIDPKELKERSKEIKPTELLEVMDTNSTKFKEQYGELKHLESKEAERHAKEIKEYSDSKGFKDLVEQNENHLLYDKEIDWGKYVATPQTEQQMQSTQPKNLNQFLSQNDKIFIVISESMPKETILNYFRTLENVNTDVTFILRGVVGNDISKITPTFNYVRDLLIKDKNGKPDDPKNRFHYQVDINPKVTQKFKIQKVPAVIYIQNYDYSLQEPTELKMENSNERYYVAYGDVGIDYALREINKKARSKSLENFIKNINKSFYK